MILSHLQLSSFKNFSSALFSFNQRFNFIYGGNGNGKTNILEAISMLTMTKSFLSNSENMCVQNGETIFSLQGKFINGSDSVHKACLSFDLTEGTKEFYYNNDKVKKFSSFYGTIPITILSPSDLRLASGIPFDRRKNFDMLISQVSRSYFDDLRKYNRMIDQKNSLLKENLVYKKYSHPEFKQMVNDWNEKLAETGERIILKRVEFVNKFKKYLGRVFEILCPARAGILYRSQFINENSENGDLRKTILEKLDSIFPDETRRGISLAGPHRDNYEFFIIKENGDEFDLKNSASQGEQKTYVISLKLAEYLYMRDIMDNSVTGSPLLLLDDVFSELDTDRINNICSLLPEFSQVFLTTANKGHDESIKKFYGTNDIEYIYIDNGTKAFQL